MGVGRVAGGVAPTAYFRPRDGNPFVLAFFASVVLLWIAGVYWICFRGGAEMLVEHPGLLRNEVSTPTQLKVVAALCLAGGVAGLAVMLLAGGPR